MSTEHKQTSSDSLEETPHNATEHESAVVEAAPQLPEAESETHSILEEQALHTTFGAPPQDFGTFVLPAQAPTATAPKKNHKGGWVALCLFVFVGLAIGAYMLLTADKLRAYKTPEAQVQFAVQHTLENILESPTGYPEFEINPDKTYEAGMAIGVTEGFESSMTSFFMSQIGVKMQAKFNIRQQQAYGSVSAQMGFATIEPSTLYLSPNEILLSVPQLLQPKDYLSINPSTFVQQFNAAQKYEADKMPAQFNVPQAISESFVSLEKLTQLWNRKTQTQRILEFGGEQVQVLLSHSSITPLPNAPKPYSYEVTLTPTHFKAYMQETSTRWGSTLAAWQKTQWDLLPEQFFILMELSPEDKKELEQSQQEVIAEMVDLLRNITIQGDMVFHLQLNPKTGRIDTLELLPTTFAIDDVAVLGKFYISFSDGAYAMQDLLTEIVVEDPEYDLKAMLQLVNRGPKSANGKGNYWEVTTTVIDEKEVLTVKMIQDFVWNPRQKQNENMSLELKVVTTEQNGASDFFREEYNVTLHGLLKNTNREVALEKGVLSYTDPDIDRVVKLSLDIACREAKGSAATIRPDATEENTMDIFETDLFRTKNENWYGAV